MVLIRKHIESISKISDEDWYYFLSRLVERNFSKKTIFLKLGEVENYISFINKGVVRLYLPKEFVEEEVTFDFSFIK
jgi:hypothetical protein